jgi:hypothetical protein
MTYKNPERARLQAHYVKGSPTGRTTLTWVNPLATLDRSTIERRQAIRVGDEVTVKSLRPPTIPSGDSRTARWRCVHSHPVG